MKSIGGNTKNHDKEFDVVRWFYLEDAVSVLYYKDEIEITQKARAVTENIQKIR